MKRIRGLVSAAAILAVLFFAAACGDEDSGDPTSPPSSDPAAVVLAAGSYGSAGDGTITGLTAGGVYVVITTEGEILGVTADGTLGASIDDAAELTVTAITGLTNGTTYDVYEVVTGAAGGTTTLDGTTYNTVVDIHERTNSQTHTVEADSAKPAAKYVVIYVGQALEAVAAGDVSDSLALEGDSLDYAFGSTAADGAKFLAVTAGDEWITLDLSALSANSSFTATITVSTAG
jgi:hypothetical protein